MSESDLDLAEGLMYLMIDRACGNEIDRDEYRRVRTAVIELAGDQAPRCAVVCRDPLSIWSYVKARDLPTYESRRAHFREEFEPLLSELEQRATTPLDEHVADGLIRLESDAVNRTWRRALDRCAKDPEGAITMARTMLESVCKAALEDLDPTFEPASKSYDLPELHRMLAEGLDLAPSQHSDKAIKRILGGMMATTNGLAHLRNNVGDSHGQGRRSYRPEPRHAMLAVNTAGSLALFLVETVEARSERR